MEYKDTLSKSAKNKAQRLRQLERKRNDIAIIKILLRLKIEEVAKVI